jgi:hypothetical protein
MFTSSVRVQADLEPHIRTVVAAYQAARPVGQELGVRAAECGEVLDIVFYLLQIKIVMAALEAVGRVISCAATSRWQTITHGHVSV